jgi:hypothetical protein
MYGDCDFAFGLRLMRAYYAAYMVVLKLLYIIGGALFVVSMIAHIYVRLYLRPKDDSELDDYYYEFEDLHPGYARYTKWLRITTGGAALGILLLFLVLVL